MLRAICCKTQRNVSLMWLSSPAFCWLNLLCVEYRNVYKTTISWLFPAQKFSIFRHETSLGMSRFEGQSSIFPGMAGAGVAAAAVCHAWHSAGKTTGSQCHCQLTTSTCGSHSSHHQRDTRTAASAGGYAPCVLRCFFFCLESPKNSQMSPDVPRCPTCGGFFRTERNREFQALDTAGVRSYSVFQIGEIRTSH